MYIPARIPAEVEEVVRETAVKVYNAVGCQGLSRVDFFVTHDENRVVFNDQYPAGIHLHFHVS